MLPVVTAAAAVLSRLTSLLLPLPQLLLLLLAVLDLLCALTVTSAYYQLLQRYC
jgi:hypothetical protein